MAKDLDDLQVALREVHNKINGASSTSSVLSRSSWNMPSLSRDDLSAIPIMLESKVVALKSLTLSQGELEKIKEVADRLNSIHGNMYSHMFNGHGHQHVPVFMATMQWVDMVISSLASWRTVSDSKSMPAAIAKRLETLREQVDSINVDKEGLIEKARLINDATHAADALPTTLSQLKRAQQDVDSAQKETSEACKRAEGLLNKIEKRHSEVASKIGEADALIERCDEAYRITTTQGLAAAFEQRAQKLSDSITFWVTGLLIALGVGSYVGSQRLALLNEALKSSSADAGLILIHVLLSVLSLGAPLWFAWLATKQIGQRFRLAEDYAFKASVAKAYEGYRKEAARLDEAFEARLFSTALTRVEEAPLRLIDDKAHGSPLHELISSEAFRSALKTAPELRDKFLEIFKDGLKDTANVARNVAHDTKNAVSFAAKDEGKG